MKFLIDNIWLIALALVSGGALAWPNLQRRGDRVSLLQATQLLNQGKAIVVDVREPAEFAVGHLRDARNIPLKELGGRIGELDKFKARTAIVVCQRGVTSSKAVSQLKKAGFAEAVSLDGGIAAWQAQSLPLVK
ncbi:rhodanese-like domain-containing protein [Noviherbaspirillum sp. UKPF54]|uniref:rhodanese-like domain-containing protein n=1 Tax=Noviherbaspirillum sp. UKPF54 TaxID=2601898 RepID=UPI0011B186AD|nr:rhodanese-like domain-containing protein [Noviherbaspirillum sp. UKPF54]QDZ29157.1 rhodanese-like domain-containing protein [Noviherbaspirillum sp. UKPF54]